MEKAPGYSEIDRRRVLAAMGAGVLVALAAFPALRQSGGEFSNNASELYPIHQDVTTTIFWAGEEGDPETNDNIHNNSSAWVSDWEASFGGVDDPDDRCGYHPCDFEPKENPFYFALPFGDYTEDGPKSAEELQAVPWFTGQMEPGESILKNRWIEITYEGKTAYAQWQDVGPFEDDDAGYVFGADEPKSDRAGLDVSPAVADYLGIDGRGQTSWRFVEEADVPTGPWREIITTSGPNWT